MTIWNKKTIVESVKDHLNTRPQEQIFSYEVSDSSTPHGLNLILLQKETDFSLSLAISKNEDQLTIKSFTLNSRLQLGEASLALFDTAMVEIALQGLEIIFQIAHLNADSHISFILPKEEAEHFSAFHSFFHSITYQGNQAHLTFPTDKAAYAIFVEQTEVLTKKNSHRSMDATTRR